MSLFRIYGTTGELLACSGINAMYQMFEMIGIYEKYISENTDLDFNEYFRMYQGTTQFHFRNKGIQFVYNNYDGELLCSKHDMRRFSRTYAGIPVVFSYFADQIILATLNIINRYDELSKVYNDELNINGADVLRAYILFQSDTLDVFINNFDSFKKYRYNELRNVLNNIRWH